MIQPVGKNGGASAMNPITKTAPVGPRIQPEQQSDENDKLRTERDTIQNQLTILKSATDAPNTEAVKQLEDKLQKVNESLAASEAGQEKPSALDRLKGQTDTYDGEGVSALDALSQDEDAEKSEPETLTVNTDSVDREVEGLKKEQKELSREADAAGKRGDEEAWNRLKEELKAVQAELQQKDTDAYRRQHSPVSGLN